MVVVGSLVRSISPPLSTSPEDAHGPPPVQLGGGVKVQVSVAFASVHWPTKVQPEIMSSETHCRFVGSPLEQEIS